jgi:hypothetical protein
MECVNWDVAADPGHWRLRAILQGHAHELPDGGRGLWLLRRAEAEVVEDALDGDTVEDVGDDRELRAALPAGQGVGLVARSPRTRLA